MQPGKNSLIVFVREPRPGAVKTRLEPALGPNGAARVYRAFVEDLAARFETPAAFGVHWFFCPPDTEHVFRDWLGTGLQLHPQQGSDLGARLCHAFRSAFEKGAPKVVVIGSDMPTLEPSVVDEALCALERCDLVLGPAEDGGYYLIGLKAPQRLLFTNMPWGTDRVLAITRERAASAGLSTILLAEGRDMDTFDDLRYLGAALGRHGEGEHGLSLPRTFEALRTLNVMSRR